jgi:Helix-turn-helix domain of resolvase
MRKRGAFEAKCLGTGTTCTNCITWSAAASLARCGSPKTLSIWQLIAADYCRAWCGFKWLGDPWADTTTPHGKLMITVLGGLASEGRERAKARSVKFGRKPKLTKHQRDQALARKAAEEPLTEIAKTYNVSHMTISRL